MNPKKSKGTVMAEATRAATNKLTASQRQELSKTAAKLIYGGHPSTAKKATSPSIQSVATAFGKSLSKKQRIQLLALCDEASRLGASSSSLAPLFAALMGSAPITPEDLKFCPKWALPQKPAKGK